MVGVRAALRVVPLRCVSRAARGEAEAWAQRTDMYYCKYKISWNNPSYCVLGVQVKDFLYTGQEFLHVWTGIL